MKAGPPADIDAYIAGFPREVRRRLEAIRTTIAGAVPEATEAIKYQMPTFVLHGNLLHFAAFQHHIGLYPTPSGVSAFASALAKYTTGKGSVQFPLDEPTPLALIARIARHRARENREKAQARPGRKASAASRRRKA